MQKSHINQGVSLALVFTKTVAFLFCVGFFIFGFAMRVYAANCGGVTICNCGDTVTSSYTLPGDLSCTNAGVMLTIGASDIILDLGGYTIDGDDANTTIGIYDNNYTGVTVRNGTTTDATVSGVHFTGTSTGTVTNIKSNSTGNQGFQMTETPTVTFNNITANNNFDDGFSMHGGTATINGATFSGNNQGINTLENCTITGTDINITTQSGVGSYAIIIGGTNLSITGGTITGQVTDSLIQISVGSTVTLSGITAPSANSALGFVNLANVASTLTITNSNIDGTYTNGIVYGAVTDVNISDSTLSNTGTDVFLVATNKLILDNNIIGGTASYGIQLSGGELSMSRCTINGTYSESAIYSSTGSVALTVRRSVIESSNTTKHTIDILSGSSLDIGYSIIKNVKLNKYAIASRAGSTLVAKNNVFYGAGNVAFGIYGAGAVTVNNSIFTGLNGGLQLVAGGSVTASYNDFYNNTANLSGGALSPNSLTDNPLFTGIGSDFRLVSTSTAINAGTNVGLTTDYSGNSIYGAPDIGAYEYIPPYTLTTAIPITGRALLCSDGKYKMITATSSTATGTFSVTPVGGFYTASTSEYMDITINSWQTTGAKNKQWTATSTLAAYNTNATSTVYTIGDLNSNTAYTFKLDGTASTTAVANNSQCASGVCTADSGGSLTFTYQGGYSTHTFALEDNILPIITSASSNKTNGSYAIGEVIDIDITFSEKITSTGNVTVTLETGDTDRTCVFTVSNAATGSCNYTVQAGDTSSDLTVQSISASVITDAAGNVMTNFIPTTNLAANKALVIDTTAPVLSGGSPTGTHTAGVTIATLSVTTNEAATCKYGTTADIAYASMSSLFTTSNGITHAADLTGLTNSTYTYYVRCVDSLSNANTSDYTISFTIPAATAVSTPTAGGSVIMLSPTASANNPLNPPLEGGQNKIPLTPFVKGGEKQSTPATVEMMLNEAKQIINNITPTAPTALANFIANGTPTTLILGSGERAGVVNSFKSAFGRAPQSEIDWSDVIKIANGRWPSQKNVKTEANAEIAFKKIYLRSADRSNLNDDAAVTVISYGLRPANRNLNSEKAAIKSFRSIYGYTPKSAMAWDIVRAIAYSGARR